ncbi:MAG: MBL fold metallo-hydrolase [Eubacterium sp.]|jgi:glyoxylase-like metal-dependent hydrolase (beta-lactamase superfamily II)
MPEREDTEDMAECVGKTPVIERIRYEEPDGRIGNCYLVVSGAEAGIIGLPLHERATRAEIQRRLDAWAVDPSRLKLLFTHAHEGRLTRIPSFLPEKCPVYIGAQDLPNLTGTSSRRFLACLYLREGFPPEQVRVYEQILQIQEEVQQNLNYQPVQNGAEIPIGEVTLRGIHTPGHTRGHICYLLPEEGLLFTGDMLQYDGTPSVELWPEGGSAVEKMLDSLDYMKELMVKRALPGHGDLTGEYRGRIQTIWNQYYLMILQLYQTVNRSPGLSAYELLLSILKQQKKQIPASEQKKQRMMNETVACLEFLRRRGYVQTVMQDGILRNEPGERSLTDF